MTSNTTPKNRASAKAASGRSWHRIAAWGALLPLALLAACNRSAPDQGSLNEGVEQPENDLAAPEILNEAPPPAVNLAPPAPVDRIVEPDLSASEQVIDDAEATGMTARTRRELADPVSPAQEQADRRSARDADAMATQMEADDAAGYSPPVPVNKPASKDVSDQ